MAKILDVCRQDAGTLMSDEIACGRFACGSRRFAFEIAFAEILVPAFLEYR